MQQFWCDNYNVSKLKRDNTKKEIYLFSMYLKCKNVSIPQPPRENVLERRLQLVHSGKLVLLFIGCLKTILKCRCYVINTAPQSALTFIRVGIFWGGGVFQLLIGGIHPLIIIHLQTLTHTDSCAFPVNRCTKVVFKHKTRHRCKLQALKCQQINCTVKTGAGLLLRWNALPEFLGALRAQWCL